MARAFASASQQYLVGTNPVSAFPFTMACWFISNDLTSDHALMDLTNSGASYDRETMRASGDRRGDPLNYLVGQSTQIETSNSFSAGVWQHAAVIAAASNNRRAVLNGDWANSGTSATNFDDFSVINRVDIGRMGDSTPSAYLSGRVAEAAIWSVALTQVEITLLAAGASPLLVRPDALAAYWPLWGTHDPEIDLVGGYGLTLVNEPTVAVHPRVIYVPKLWAGVSITPSATIELTGIPSAEAVGQPAVDDGLTRIFPTDIPSAEAVGTPTVTPGAATIELTGIASAEAVGTPTVLLPTRRATQVIVEYDASIDHDLRATQVVVEYDWLEPEPENNVPAAMMHYQRLRRAG